LSLVAEQLAAGDVAGAARTLGTLQEHADGPMVRLRGVQVACRQGEFEPALARFRGWATDEEVTRGTLRDAILAFDAEGWGARLTTELKDSRSRPTRTPTWPAVADRAVAAGTPEAVSDGLPELLTKNPRPGARCC